jgi:hypothetical protein
LNSSVFIEFMLKDIQLGDSFMWFFIREQIMSRLSTSHF